MKAQIMQIYIKYKVGQEERIIIFGITTNSLSRDIRDELIILNDIWRIILYALFLETSIIAVKSWILY